MRKALVALVLIAAACSSPAPQQEPEVVPSQPSMQSTVYVTATTLNLREDASGSAKVVGQVKRGDALTLLSQQNGWSRVRLASGETGWVSSQHVSATKPRPKKAGCDSEFSFVKTPLPSFSDSGAHGLVVVDATVNTKGEVTATKIVSNSTGDTSLASLAEREIRSATFKPPYRDCVPRAFIFTYKRTF